MNLSVSPHDRAVFQESLADFLPDDIVDVHAHVWLRAFATGHTPMVRGAQWALAVASEQTPEVLAGTYAALFPGRRVTPVLFGWPERYIDIAANNAWVAAQARQQSAPALCVSLPETPAETLDAIVQAGGFVGLKPYLEFAPPHLGPDEITIFDFLPRAQLEIASQRGWIVMLHVPRSRRLGDPLNLAQLVEIERVYPGVQLIVAHLGRAYCPEDLGDALAVLRNTERLAFDFSANTSAWVMTELLRTVGASRVLFGSDLPITRMRLRRECRQGTYVNLVPPGLYTDVYADPHLEEIGAAEAEALTFFLYEELLAMRQAVTTLRLPASAVEAIFVTNARTMVARAHRSR